MTIKVEMLFEDTYRDKLNELPNYHILVYIHLQTNNYNPPQS